MLFKNELIILGYQATMIKTKQYSQEVSGCEEKSACNHSLEGEEGKIEQLGIQRYYPICIEL